MNPHPGNNPKNLVTVFVIDAFCLPPEIAASHLSHDELARAGKFKREEDARRWASYRASLKLTLGSMIGVPAKEVGFILNPAGKPELETRFQSLHFNLSHCDDLALIAVSRECAVGIDIESNSRAPDLLECESTFCHPAEIPSLPPEQAEREAALLELWTAKEAFLKAIGTGLSNPPEDIRVRVDGGSSVATTRDGAFLPLIRLRHPCLVNHTAHLCALRPIDSVEILTGLPHMEQMRPS